ncbi:hypothetical protein CHUAL_010310 [Chamberlinius hualienensis]
MKRFSSTVLRFYNGIPVVFSKIGSSFKNGRFWWTMLSSITVTICLMAIFLISSIHYVHVQTTSYLLIKKSTIENFYNDLFVLITQDKLQCDETCFCYLKGTKTGVFLERFICIQLNFEI